MMKYPHSLQDNILVSAVSPNRPDARRILTARATSPGRRTADRSVDRTRHKVAPKSFLFWRSLQVPCSAERVPVSARRIRCSGRNGNPPQMPCNRGTNRLPAPARMVEKRKFPAIFAVLRETGYASNTGSRPMRRANWRSLANTRSPASARCLPRSLSFSLPRSTVSGAWGSTPGMAPETR
jgi:hypothetical protein